MTSSPASAWPRPTPWWIFSSWTHCLREDLNKRAKRVMAVLRPLKLVIENWPKGQVEELEAVNNPEDPLGRKPEDSLLWGALY